MERHLSDVQMSLEADRRRARELDVDDLADAIEEIGFECTRCGGCCTGFETEAGDVEPHTATLFPDEARALQAAAADAFDVEYDWRDVARPMPYGLDETPDGLVGETFEWAIQTDDCGDCTFYTETDGIGACTVHEDRPLICRTYPFSVDLDGAAAPMGDTVDRRGSVLAHECEGLGRDISRSDAEALARALKRRAIREVEEAISLRNRYTPRPDRDGVIVHDSEGAKRPDGSLVACGELDDERDDSDARGA